MRALAGSLYKAGAVVQWWIGGKLQQALATGNVGSKNLGQALVQDLFAHSAHNDSPEPAFAVDKERHGQTINKIAINCGRVGIKQDRKVNANLFQEARDGFGGFEHIDAEHH